MPSLSVTSSRAMQEITHSSTDTERYRYWQHYAKSAKDADTPNNDENDNNFKVRLM